MEVRQHLDAPRRHEVVVPLLGAEVVEVVPVGQHDAQHQLRITYGGRLAEVDGADTGVLAPVEPSTQLGDEAVQVFHAVRQGATVVTCGRYAAGIGRHGS